MSTSTDASISISYDSSGWDSETTDLVNQTVSDTEAYCNDLLQMKSDWEALQDSLDSLDYESDTALVSCFMVLTQVSVLVEDSMQCLAGVENIEADSGNLNVQGQNDYNAMVSDASNGETVNPEDAQNMVNVSDALTETTFNIAYTDENGVTTTATATGLLDLLSDDGTEGDEWSSLGNGNAAGKAPMSMQTVNMISESYQGIENCFTDYGDADSMAADVDQWVPSTEEEGTDTDGDGNPDDTDNDGDPDTTDGDVPTLSTNIDTVNSNYDQVNSSVETASQATQSQLQQAYTLDESYNKATKDMMDNYDKMLAAMNQNMGV